MFKKTERRSVIVKTLAMVTTCVANVTYTDSEGERGYVVKLNDDRASWVGADVSGVRDLA